LKEAGTCVRQKHHRDKEEINISPGICPGSDSDHSASSVTSIIGKREGLSISPVGKGG